MQPNDDRSNVRRLNPVKKYGKNSKFNTVEDKAKVYCILHIELHNSNDNFLSLNLVSDFFQWPIVLPTVHDTELTELNKGDISFQAIFCCVF